MYPHYVLRAHRNQVLVRYILSNGCGGAFAAASLSAYMYIYYTHNSDLLLLFRGRFNDVATRFFFASSTSFYFIESFTESKKYKIK